MKIDIDKQNKIAIALFQNLQCGRYLGVTVTVKGLRKFFLEHMSITAKVNETPIL